MAPDAHRLTNRTIRLDLPLILPDVRDAQDACIVRLLRLLERREGVVEAHVLRPGQKPPPGHEIALDDMTARGAPGVSDRLADAQLCLHYDPDVMTLGEVTELVRLAGADVTDRFGHLVIPFRLVGSEDDGQRLEAGLCRVPGVSAAAVNLAGQVARVEYDRRRVTAAQIGAALRELGASDVWVSDETTPSPASDTRTTTTPDHSSPGWYARNRELAWSLASGVLLVAAWAGEKAGLPHAGAIALFVLSYLFGASDNVGHLLKDLRKGHFHFNIDFLMVVAAVGAAILGEWAEGALLLFLFSLGHALEHYALGRARNAISALAELAPQRATVVRGGAERDVAIEAVVKGDQVVTKPGERIAVDGVVREGQSSVNQAPITGESVPVEKAVGDTVFAGTVNGDGALVVEVTGVVGDRTLDRVIKLVSEAETQKAPTQQFTERFERVFVPLVLLADVALIALPPLLGIWTLSDSFYRAMALLVAASPCALALGTPAAVLAGIAQAARRGVLVKGGAHLETLGTIGVVAFDKTGTITRGEPEVTDVVAASGIAEERLLSLAAAAERRSQHPLARAIIAAAESRQLGVPEARDVEAVMARGVRARVEETTVEVGRLLMFEEAGLAVPAPLRQAIARLEEAGRTTMLVRAGDEWLGVLGVADQPRSNARETLDRLRDAGVRKIVMLTGDNEGVGRAVGAAVGVDEVRAGLMPEDKVTAIRELAALGPVAMVGDGVNDAPALANATVGIAMGGAGTAAALETADVALMGDDLSRLPFAIGLSRQARRIIRQNLWISLSVIAVLAIATVAGVAGIGPAVIAHEGSTLVVIANALRLLAYGGRGAE